MTAGGNALDGALVALAFTTGLLGFSALVLAMDRHYEDCFGRGQAPGRKRPWLRLLGSVALLASLLACLAVDGRAQGGVFWLGALTVCGWGVVAVSTYRPTWLARLVGVAGAMVACAAVSAMLVR